MEGERERERVGRGRSKGRSRGRGKGKGKGKGKEKGRWSPPMLSAMTRGQTAVRSDANSSVEVCEIREIQGTRTGQQDTRTTGEQDNKTQDTGHRTHCTQDRIIRIHCGKWSTWSAGGPSRCWVLVVEALVGACGRLADWRTGGLADWWTGSVAAWQVAMDDGSKCNPIPLTSIDRKLAVVPCLPCSNGLLGKHCYLLGGGGILQDSTIPTWHSSQCRLWLPERGKEMGTLL